MTTSRTVETQMTGQHEPLSKQEVKSGAPEGPHYEPWCQAQVYALELYSKDLELFVGNSHNLNLCVTENALGQADKVQINKKKSLTAKTKLFISYIKENKQKYQNFIKILSDSRDERKKQIANNINVMKSQREKELTDKRRLEKLVCKELSPALKGKTLDFEDLQLSDIFHILKDLTSEIVELRKKLAGEDDKNGDALKILEEKRMNLEITKFEKVQREFEDLQARFATMANDNVELKKKEIEFEKLQSDHLNIKNWADRLETEKKELDKNLTDIKTENGKLMKLCEQYEGELSRCTCARKHPSYDADTESSEDIETDAQGHMPKNEGQMANIQGQMANIQGQRSAKYPISNENVEDKILDLTSSVNNNKTTLKQQFREEQNKSETVPKEPFTEGQDKGETAPKEPFTEGQDSRETSPKDLFTERQNICEMAPKQPIITTQDNGDIPLNQQTLTRNHFDVDHGQWLHCPRSPSNVSGNSLSVQRGSSASGTYSRNNSSLSTSDSKSENGIYNSEIINSKQVQVMNKCKVTINNVFKPDENGHWSAPGC